MTAHVRVSGQWEEITAIHARVSGGWKEVVAGWTRVSGTWEQFYQRGIEVAVTAANNGAGTFRGYSTIAGTTGAASPDNFEGNDFIQIGIFISTGNLRVAIDNQISSNAFSAIVTSTGTYQTADATFNIIGSFPNVYGQWDWFVDASPFNSQTVLFIP